jgi:hypothetical protein
MAHDPAGATYRASQGAEHMPITVGNPVAFGKLVKSWATGETYFSDDPNSPYKDNPPPIPRTMAIFQDQCRLAKCNVTVSAEITGLQFVQYTSNTFIIKLPPKDLIERTEQILQAGGKYPVPAFYDDFFTLKDMTTAEKMDFHAIRTTDYICGQCG